MTAVLVAVTIGSWAFAAASVVASPTSTDTIEAKRIAIFLTTFSIVLTGLREMV